MDMDEFDAQLRARILVMSGTCRKMPDHKIKELGEQLIENIEVTIHAEWKLYCAMGCGHLAEYEKRVSRIARSYHWIVAGEHMKELIKNRGFILSLAELGCLVRSICLTGVFRESIPIAILSVAIKKGLCTAPVESA